jgi:4-amino-4-deoxychorismate lyase
MNPLLFETIKIEDGQISNILWHNRRCNQSRFELFNRTNFIDLEQYITPPTKGIYRCRIIYGTEIQSIKYIPYTPKKIKIFKIVKSQLDYSYKYEKRDEINKLVEGQNNEIIIEKDGLLTDTSIANIAFYTGNRWITPKKPLLKGTIRAKLLAKNFLIPKDIKKEELQNFSHFALMNAMIGFQIQKSINIYK